MIAVVNIAGQQFKVSKGQKLYVHRQEAETGSQVNFDQVLMLINGEQTTIECPTLQVQAFLLKC